MNNSIPFSKHLSCIKLDNPKRCFAQSQVNVYQYAYDKSHEAVNSVGLNINIIENYRNMDETKYESVK
ncbi:MAG: hypothetical protein K0R54_4597 [Clostridiaceae bacterium]|jgi:hypothetical protein|nr:hypothetical protein [Clostridiaceae bacterium]